MSEKNTKDLQKEEKDIVKKTNTKSTTRKTSEKALEGKSKQKTNRKSKVSDKAVDTSTTPSEEKDIKKEPKKKTRTKKATPTKKVANEKKEKKRKATNTTETSKATTKKVAKSSTSIDTKKTTTKKAKVKKSVSKTLKSKKKTNKKIIKSAKTISLANKLLRKNVEILQYFELPYRYNETTVKILAQTPKTLFVYWDIADHDIDQYRLNYGDNFFNETYPVLLVKNETYGYVEEITINDFANSWYLHIKDPNSKYSIELGRRYQNKSKFESPYIYVKNSNEIIVPNDKVLIDTLKPTIKYRNVKTNEVTYKNINNIIKNEQILDLYSLYKFIYNTENITESFDFLNNPSSGNPTSSFK